MSIDISYTNARFNMVEQQIRPWDVSDTGILDLFMELHREDFINEPYKAQAFADLELPLGHGQSMMSPKLEARLLQALALKQTDEVFELGTGSGFLTACLAKLAHHVDSVEWHGEWCETASDRLAAAGIQNATIEQGDASKGGLHSNKRYDAIVLTASFPEYPKHFETLLKPGGRVFVIVGNAPVMNAQLVTCDGDGECHRVTLFETCLPAAQGLEKPSSFTF